MAPVNSALRLKPSEIKVLVDLLNAAFLPQDFDNLLYYELERSQTSYVSPADSYPTVLRKVLEAANAQLWWRDLLHKARNVVPADPGLAEFGERFGLSPQTYVPGLGGMTAVHGPELELRIKVAQSTFDILTWRRRLGEIEGRVCRIEFPEKTAQGTGFLVGPNVALTNYHVVRKIQQGEISPSQVVFRFDYKVLDDGVAVHAGTTYRLAANWLVDWSPYSARDTEVTPSADPRPDELDYAILRVEGTPGEDPVGGATVPNPTPRKWIEVPAEAYDFAAQPGLYIVQHPEGKPMQVALDSGAVLGLNGNATRVRYTTTTEPGSSGSPCFGPDWQWVALHHSGDPKYWALGLKPQYNEGIPLPAIRRLLSERGKEKVLGGGA